MSADIDATQERHKRHTEVILLTAPMICPGRFAVR